MAWPGITDFTEAVQNPQLCFQGTDLEGGSVKLNPRGMPLVYSGAFASVYQVSAGGVDYAVRCFTREVSDQQSRYEHLSNYLIHVLPPSFVHFAYQEQGIKVRGTWYPIVRMEWVEGEILSKCVEFNLKRPDVLRLLAARWRGGTTSSLRGLGIAHNDLQHGNVLVQDDGRIRLVDYDGMFLPRFRGERSPELGHKNYQHPKRTAEDYDDYVDNFPALVVYLSLLALAADPGLWSFYNDDNLILTNRDYEDPSSSKAFGALKKSPDPAVVELTGRLEELCDAPADKVPNLEEILQDISISAPSAGSGAATATPSGRPPAPPPTKRPASSPPPAAASRSTSTPASRPVASPTPWSSATPSGRPPPARTAGRSRIRRRFAGQKGRSLKWLMIGYGVTAFGLLLQASAFVNLLRVLVILAAAALLLYAIVIMGRSGRTDMLLTLAAAGVVAIVVAATPVFGWLADGLWRPITFFGGMTVLVAGVMDIVNNKESKRRKRVGAAIVVALVTAMLFLFLTPVE